MLFSHSVIMLSGYDIIVVAIQADPRSHEEESQGWDDSAGTGVVGAKRCSTDSVHNFFYIVINTLKHNNKHK